MKVKEITVSTGRKMGLPGYSSFDVNAFVTVSLEDGDDPQEAYKRAWDTVDEQVVEHIRSKGLESPVAAEAQTDKPDDWLDHDTPDQQKARIATAKKSKEISETLQKENSIPSIMPTSGR